MDTNTNGQSTPGEEKPKRTRRTKEQIAADNAAKAGPDTSVDAQANTGESTTEASGEVPGPQSEVSDSPGPGGSPFTITMGEMNQTFGNAGNPDEVKVEVKEENSPQVEEALKKVPEEKKQEAAKALSDASEATGLSKETLLNIIAILDKDDVEKLKRVVAGTLVGLIRENKDFKVLTCPHKLAVQVINYPGVFFDVEQKILTYEGHSVQLVIDNDVEKLGLS